MSAPRPLLRVGAWVVVDAALPLPAGPSFTSLGADPEDPARRLARLLSWNDGELVDERRVRAALLARRQAPVDATAIPAVHDVTELAPGSGSPLVVEDFTPGLPLARLPAIGGGALPPEIALALLRDLARGLAALDETDAALPLVDVGEAMVGLDGRARLPLALPVRARAAGARLAPDARAVAAVLGARGAGLLAPDAPPPEVARALARLSARGPDAVRPAALVRALDDADAAGPDDVAAFLASALPRAIAPLKEAVEQIELLSDDALARAHPLRPGLSLIA